MPIVSRGEKPAAFRNLKRPWLLGSWWVYNVSPAKWLFQCCNHHPKNVLPAPLHPPVTVQTLGPSLNGKIGSSQNCRITKPHGERRPNAHLLLDWTQKKIPTALLTGAIIWKMAINDLVFYGCFGLESLTHGTEPLGSPCICSWLQPKKNDLVRRNRHPQAEHPAGGGASPPLKLNETSVSTLVNPTKLVVLDSHPPQRLV